MKKRVVKKVIVNKPMADIALWKIVLFFVVVVLGVILILDAFSIKEIRADGLSSYNPLRMITNLFGFSGVVDSIIYDAYGNKIYGSGGSDSEMIYGTKGVAGDTGGLGDLGPQGVVPPFSCSFSSDSCGIETDDCPLCQKCEVDIELIRELYPNEENRPEAICVFRSEGDNDDVSGCLKPDICNGYGGCSECASPLDCVKSVEDINVDFRIPTNVGELNFKDLYELFKSSTVFSVPGCVEIPGSMIKKCSSEKVVITESDFKDWWPVYLAKNGVEIEDIRDVLEEIYDSDDLPPSS